MAVKDRDENDKPRWSPFKWRLADSHRAPSEIIVHADLSGTQHYKHVEPSGDAKLLARIKASALEAAREAIAADPAVRSILRNMLEGRGQDDDLTRFQADPDFRRLILGT